MELPVYLFTGFLEAGKTKFIQETLEDERFNKGENTLLLLCEEGEEEYHPSTFSGKNVFIERIEKPEDLIAETLSRLVAKHAAERVMVEYNGMWLLDPLYQNLPEEWIVYQEFLFVDARTFLSYNANLRGLVVDKLKSCEMVVFNRATNEIDRLEFHKIVRGVSRRVTIAYEMMLGDVVYDDIEDELPFDINAPVIEIGLQDYATWYRDISEDLEKYKGKTIRLSGYVIHRADLPEGSFIFGRQVMTCCIDDITFAGILCLWSEEKTLDHQQWVELTAKIILRNHKVYGKKGPIFQVVSVTPGQAPEQDVATFY